MRWMVRYGVGLVALLLAGCGFQLRGQAQLPPELKVTYVRENQQPPGVLGDKLRWLLASNGVTITRDPAQATTIITILNEGSGRRTLATDRSGAKREYAVVYYATYEVKLANGKTLVPVEGINANRTLLFDENRVLGFEGAQETLVSGMAEDVAWQIIRRLQAVKS